MQEVKYLYQNFKLNPDQTGVSIINDSLFADLTDYELEYALYLEGKELYRNKLEVNVGPQRSGRAEFKPPADITSASGEHCIQTSLVLKENTLWAEAGYEIAFGQFVFQVKAEEKSAAVQGELRVVEGDVNIGVHGRDFTILFSKQAGSLVSLNYAGREMIALPPAPLFWRATTDNDQRLLPRFPFGALVRYQSDQKMCCY